jgi:hypothetical protein
MTVIGALSSFRELGYMSPQKRPKQRRFSGTGSSRDFSRLADVPVLIHVDAALVI